MAAAASYTTDFGLGRFSTLRQLLIRIALGFIFLSTSFQYIHRVRHDRYKCKSLLHSGSWAPSPDANRPFLRWAPDDGTLHEYTRDDTVSCLRGRRIVFVGDSWMRQLFWAASTHLDHFKQELATLDFHLSGEKGRNLALEAEGVRLEFIWDPWLNSTGVARELARFKPVMEGNEKKHPDASIDIPALLVVGAPGLWATRHGGKAYMDIFRTGVDPLLPHMKVDLDPSLASWPAARRHSFQSIPNQLVVVPVPTLQYNRLTPSRKQTMTPEKIRSMNNYLRTFPANAQSHMPWAFNQMIESHEDAYNVNGIHVAKDVRERAFNLLLNVRCNAGLDPSGEGVSSLACRATEWPTLIQCAIVLVGIVATPLAFIKAHTKTPAIASVAPVSLGALLCYMTEKTHIFTSMNRAWDSTQFTWKLIAFVLLSFVTLTPRHSPIRPSPKPQPAMPREYSDELKGLLQVVILLYGQYDGNSSLSAYKVFRITVASYIFLSSYGHATYFLTTKDYSFRRIAAVLLRFNLLSCILAFTVSTPWTAYYFAPLISFWFLVTYTILAVHKASNDNIPILFLKIVGAAAVGNLLILHSDLIEQVISVANLILRSSWSGGKMARELAFDSITPFIAILSASLAHRATQLRDHSAPASGTPGPNIFAEFLDDVISAIAGHESSRFGAGQLAKTIFTAIAVFILALLTFIFSDTVMRYRDTTELCHPLISWIPILAAVYLRGTRKGGYLAFPAFLGKIALELYLLQNHLWLVDSGTHILGVWPRDDRASFLSQGIYYFQRAFITVAFVWVANECHHATRSAVNLILGTPADAEHAETLDADLLESKGAEVKLLKAHLQDRQGANWTSDARVRVGIFLGALWVAHLFYGL
ncbi:hypothetical protein jhhlp_000902 [Lomentospora prolificans]|uniref:Cas1p 10 TM acyl transferase domain-containing protein n=1 Tax=Lomentospora prolificans TaxID=41688 RepID=A0A2N3NJU8_9PEZI|nr:hypothetical protein jhhlp_000902 [Lomentospora prolificans]